MAIGASNVETKKQVESGDELLTESVLNAAIGFPLGQLRGLGRRTAILMSAPVSSSSWPGCLLLHFLLVCLGFLLKPWELQ